MKKKICLGLEVLTLGFCAYAVWNQFYDEALFWLVASFIADKAGEK